MPSPICRTGWAIVVRGGCEWRSNLMSSNPTTAGCPDKTVDMALARTIRLGGNRARQFRVDAFNVSNTVVIPNHERNVC